MRLVEIYHGRFAELSEHNTEMQFIKSSIESARSIAEGLMRGLGMNVARSEWGVCSDTGTTDSLNLDRYVVNESDDSFASENATSMTNPRAPDHFSPTDDCIAQSHPVFRWPNLPQVEEKEFRIPYFWCDLAEHPISGSSSSVPVPVPVPGDALFNKCFFLITSPNMDGF